MDPGADRTALTSYGVPPATAEPAPLVDVAVLVEAESLVELEQSTSARP